MVGYEFVSPCNGGNEYAIGCSERLSQFVYVHFDLSQPYREIATQIG